MLGISPKLCSEVSALVHKQEKREAAKLVCDAFQLKMGNKHDNPKEYDTTLVTFLHGLLDNGLPELAAQLLWTPSQFTPDPQCTKDVWSLFKGSTQGLIMGAGSMSKSYGMGVRMFLEWVRDPKWTSIKVIGPSEDHLEANLFSHLVRLHSSASLPMPGEVGELFIGFSRRDQLSAIKGVVIPIGQTKKAGRIQGAKRIPRPTPHPRFGPLSRMFIFCDEAENVPGGLWSDIDNILTQVTKEGADGFKIFMSYNPTDVTSNVAKRAEPEFGWDAFDVDKHFRWKSTRGWDVLRLDGEKSENVLAGRTIFPGLQTREGLEAIAKNAGGTNSPGYFSMGRGAYPPTGIEMALIPPGLFARMRGEFIWLEAPQPCAGLDMALEGTNNAIYTLGKCGRSSGKKLPPSLEFPQGRTVMFKDRSGHNIVRFGIQAEQQFVIPKGDSVALARRTIEINKRAGVRPEYFACDRTGPGSGAADLIKNEWSSAIHDINYMESPSNDRIMVEDTKTCEEDFNRLWTELWYGLRMLGEFGYVLLAPQLELEKLTGQVTQRKLRTVGKKKQIESKKDYISRGNPSPDEADSLTLFIYAARKGSGQTFSMKEDAEISMMFTGEDGWEEYEYSQYPGGVRLDPTARTDWLDTRQIDGL